VSRSREWYPDRTLAALMAVGIANHVLLSGARVAVSLDALARGASAALVGLLMALFALLPMLLAIHAGRLADRAGVRRPMLWGTAGGIAAMLLPAVWPGLPALFAASLLAGVSFMLFQVPAQRAVGDLGEADERAANYSWYALPSRCSRCCPLSRSPRSRDAWCACPRPARTTRRPGRRACSTSCAIRCCAACSR
jgi:MFS family permease